MIIDPLWNPPMPEWNDLKNEDRNAIVECGRYMKSWHEPAYCIYIEVRKILKKREKWYAEHIMGKRVRVKMGRRVI